MAWIGTESLIKFIKILTNYEIPDNDGKLFNKSSSKGDDPKSVEVANLPLTSFKFLNESIILASGHNYEPTVLAQEKGSGNW